MKAVGSRKHVGRRRRAASSGRLRSEGCTGQSKASNARRSVAFETEDLHLGTASWLKRQDREHGKRKKRSAKKELVTLVIVGSRTGLPAATTQQTHVFELQNRIVQHWHLVPTWGGTTQHTPSRTNVESCNII